MKLSLISRGLSLLFLKADGGHMHEVQTIFQGASGENLSIVALGRPDFPGNMKRAGAPKTCLSLSGSSME